MTARCSNLLVGDGTREARKNCLEPMDQSSRIGLFLLLYSEGLSPSLACIDDGVKV